MPRRITQAAAHHARELGRDVMSDGLLLVGLLELDPEQPARRALECERVTVERVLEQIRVSGDERAAESRGVTYSPASYTIQGRAEGFAAALGDGRITPEHVLLALLWDPVGMASHILWELGVERARVVDRLHHEGVPVPAASLPPQREVDLGDRVWFDRDKVKVVLDGVRQHLPPETHWGFNYADDRAWIIAESSVDLQALVDDVLATG